MLCWQLLIWTVFFNVAPHSGLYSRLLAVLDERTRSVAAPGTARHRLAWLHQRSASALGSSTSCINMSCHYHSEAPKSPSCQPKAGLRTHAAVCVWFGGVSGMWSTRPWLVPRCASAHSRSGSRLRKQIEAHCKQMKILPCISLTVLTSLPKNMIWLRLVDHKNGRKKVTFMTYYVINMR